MSGGPHPEIRRRLREALDAAALTQTAAAARAGVSNKYLGQILQGERGMGRVTAEKLSRVLRRQPSWLMGLSEDPGPGGVLLSEDELHLVGVYRELGPAVRRALAGLAGLSARTPRAGRLVRALWEVVDAPRPERNESATPRGPAHPRRRTPSGTR